MDQALGTIPLLKLIIAFVQVIFVLIILACWSLPKKRSLHALVRMLVQLLLVGYVLSYIFESDNAWIIACLLFAISISSFIVLLVITQGVLNLVPCYEP